MSGSQPLLVVGDLNADRGVIPCLAKSKTSGRFVDLALAYSVGAGMEPDTTCKCELDECAGSRRDSVVACPCALAASGACRVTDRRSTPHFSLSLPSLIFASGLPRCLVLVDTPGRSASSSSDVVQDIWDVYREELSVLPSPPPSSLPSPSSPSLILALVTRCVCDVSRVCFLTPNRWLLSRFEQGCVSDEIAWHGKNSTGRGVAKWYASGADSVDSESRTTLSGHTKTSYWIPVSVRSAQLSSKWQSGFINFLTEREN